MEESGHTAQEAMAMAVMNGRRKCQFLGVSHPIPPLALPVDRYCRIERRVRLEVRLSKPLIYCATCKRQCGLR